MERIYVSLGLLAVVSLLNASPTVHAEPIIPLAYKSPFSGWYVNQGMVSVQRRDTPANHKVSLGDLLLTGIAQGRVERVHFEYENAGCRIVFADSRGGTLNAEEITPQTNNLRIEADKVSFQKTFKSTNESGRVTLTITYNISTDLDGNLVVEAIYNYITKYLLFLSTKGQDRGVYRFKRA